MKLSDIKIRAGRLGIKTGRMKKEEIVRTIQKTEGNRDCFNASEIKDCGRTECLWREDCAAH